MVPSISATGLVVDGGRRNILYVADTDTAFGCDLVQPGGEVS